MITMMNRTYSELIRIPRFEDRYEYLKIGGVVAEETFGGHRYLNQLLYNRAEEWKRIRRRVIVRDNGCDLADPEHPIHGKIIVHHLNPITIEDILNRSSNIFDMENLVCVSFETHNAIHYGDATLLKKDYVPRVKNDTCPWR